MRLVKPALLAGSSSLRTEILRGCSWPRLPHGNRPHNALPLGEEGFADYLTFVDTEITNTQAMLLHYEKRKKRTKAIVEGDEVKRKHELQATRSNIEVPGFHEDVSLHWGAPGSRVLGHLLLAPPSALASTGPIDTPKMGAHRGGRLQGQSSNFLGNAIDLGTDMTGTVFNTLMNIPSFEYPDADRLLRISGTISEAKLRNPQEVDKNNDLCLVVIKRGLATGLTVGHANDIISYARVYERSGDVTGTSREWAILPMPESQHTFSEPGDSDRRGLIGGLLTGGTGAASLIDITYATPVDFILHRLEDFGFAAPNVNLV
ncbi:hypothetical protein C8J57DRAFT_1444259 [Mycena rebaudengoi]|nr:hypothetical protein C8J57DRAFT_1444259 [Mycena rebaudengoi]